MSKKLLIILISVVLFVGGAVTLSVVYFTGFYYQAKKSLKCYSYAKTITSVLCQTSQGVEINRIVTRYEKTENGYDIKEKQVLLSPDPLSEEIYTVKEKTYEAENINPIVFKMKAVYFENEEGISDGLFKADVKENKVEKFFSLQSGAEKVKLVVNYQDEKVDFYEIIYTVSGDEFTLTVTFDY